MDIVVISDSWCKEQTRLGQDWGAGVALSNGNGCSFPPRLHGTKQTLSLPRKYSI